MNCRIATLVLLYILGYNYCDQTAEHLNQQKGVRSSILQHKFEDINLLNKFPIENSGNENASLNKQNETPNDDPDPQSSSFSQKLCNYGTSLGNSLLKNSVANSEHKIESPTLSLQLKRYKITPEKKDKHSVRKNLSSKKTPNLNLHINQLKIIPEKKIIPNVMSYNEKMPSVNKDEGIEYYDQADYLSTLKSEQGNVACSNSDQRDIRFDILELEELKDHERKQIAGEHEFIKEKIGERVQEDQEFSLIDPEEDQIDVWDDTQIYQRTGSEEERMLKLPREVSNPRKVVIRNNPELKGYTQSDMDFKEMKSRKFKQDQELEFIETSQEAQHMFETAGSPFRSVKSGPKDPLFDEDIVALDMPLGHTPDGIRDIVEEYFWGDFPSFNYESDRVNPPDSLAHIFEVYSNTKSFLDLAPKHHLNVFQPGFKDLMPVRQKIDKDIKVLISERRDLLTIKDRPFSLTRSISKGFKNIFMGRKSRKAKQKFLADLRNAIIEWSNEYDNEFPMITLSPNKYISPKIIRDALNSNENKNMSLDLKRRLEFMEEIFKREDVSVPEDSTLFDTKMSKKLFPELKWEDIPDIKGVPVEELMILSSTGILPNMGDFEYTLNSIRNELMDAERQRSRLEDPLDPKMVRRHKLIRGLPPIYANEDELAQWEMDQRDKMLQEEYDEYGHRKFKLSQLPLDRPVGLPNIKSKPSSDRRVGKVIATDEEVQKLRRYEKDMYPEFIKKSDRLNKEAEIRKIAHAIDQRDQVEADLKKIPAAFKSKIRAASQLSETEDAVLKKDRRKELERPSTTAKTHLDKNLRRAKFESSYFNYGSSSDFGDNLNDILELKEDVMLG
ncbi:kinesin-like protein [Cryptosporidium canis]|uniref:Kinesin-like protein n=1 Tax=Cryptosporidium canis TaxID=195482 RepID=A0ABQ8PBT5_9CRYT|nr:kinesin-like protein [Cryptosporidium canis]KAJ1615444.1 kinesin-like protein [Cryptosporidium canis]